MIQSDTLYVEYDCDGVVEEFNIGLEYLKTAENIAVYYTVVATGAEYLLIKDTNYTVDTQENTIETTTGEITDLGSTSSPYASGIKLTIKLDAPYTQLTDITSNANYDPENLENTYDKNTILTKQNKDGIDRSVRLQESDVGISMIMPPIDDLKNGVLGFDANGIPQSHPGFIPRMYDATYRYSTNDIIQYNGLFYIAIQSTLGNDPVVGDYWGLYNLQNINSWDNLTAYSVDAVVSYLGSLYICILESTGDIPSSSPTYWVIWPEKIGTPSTFTQEGNGVVITSTINPSITALSSSRIAFIDTGNKDLRTYVFDGSDWTQSGSGLSISITSVQAGFCSLTSTKVAIAEASLDTIVSYDWNGSSWSVDVSTSSITMTATPTIIAISPLDIIVADSGGDTFTVYHLHSTAVGWAKKGISFSLSGMDTSALTSLSSTNFIHYDSSNEVLQVYEWSGYSFSILSEDTPITTTTYPSLTALSPTKIAFIEDTAQQLRTYDLTVLSVGTNPNLDF